MSDDPSLEFLDLNEIPDNSIIVIKVDVAGPMEKFIAAKGMYKTLYAHRYLLSGKRISVLTLTPKESIEVVTEEDMNNVGWYRKQSYDKTKTKKQQDSQNETSGNSDGD